MGGACSTYGGEERRIQGKKSLGRPRRRWQDNIEMDFMTWDVEVWTGLSWLRIGTVGGHL